MNLQALAHALRIPLIVVDSPRAFACADALGVIGSSPYAQACERGVLTLGTGIECAYSVCHELAHKVVGFDALGGPAQAEARVLVIQRDLAAALDPPLRRAATPDAQARADEAAAFAKPLPNQEGSQP